MFRMPAREPCSPRLNGFCLKRVPEVFASPASTNTEFDLDIFSCTWGHQRCFQERRGFGPCTGDAEASNQDLYVVIFNVIHSILRVQNYFARI